MNKEKNRGHFFQGETEMISRERDKAFLSLLHGLVMHNPKTASQWKNFKEIEVRGEAKEAMYPVARRLWEALSDDIEARSGLLSLLHLGDEGIRYQELVESVSETDELLDLFEAAKEKKRDRLLEMSFG